MLRITRLQCGSSVWSVSKCIMEEISGSGMEKVDGSTNERFQVGSVIYLKMRGVGFKCVISIHV